MLNTSKILYTMRLLRLDAATHALERESAKELKIGGAELSIKQAPLELIMITTTGGSST